MAKENIESQPKLNLDGKEYDYDLMTDFQKLVFNDIAEYQKQINRLERWKVGQVHVFRASLAKEEEAKNDETPKIVSGFKKDKKVA